MSGERWAVSIEEVGTSACSVRREHKSYNLTQIPRISQNIALSLWRDWRDLREKRIFRFNSSLIAHCSRPKNLFFCSSVKNQNLRSSVESVSSACHWKFFTKLYFRINPAGKSKVPSWKIFISQLENYFFPLCCFPNNLEYFFVCFLFFINQLPISPIFYLFS